VVLAFVIGVFIAFMSPVANATYILKLKVDDTTNFSGTISDGGTLDENNASNKITFTVPDTWGNWEGSVTVGLTNPGEAYLDMAGLSSSTSAGTLNMWLTLVGINLGNSVPTYVVRTVAGGTLAAGGTFTLGKYIDYGNLDFGTGTSVHSWSVSNSSDSSIAFSIPGDGLTTTVASTASDFSLTDHITVTHSESGNTSFNVENTVTPIPEPGTLLLLGSGLVGLAGYAKLRLKKRNS
jgi:hypothetical protein